MSPVRFCAGSVAGMFLRVISWPMSFIVLGQGRAAVLFGRISLLTRFTWAWAGLDSSSSAFWAPAWLFRPVYLPLVYDLRGCPEDVRILLVICQRASFATGVITVAITLCVRLRLQEPWATITGCALALIVGIYCLRALVLLVGIEEINKYTRKIGISLPMRKAPAVHEAAIVASRE